MKMEENASYSPLILNVGNEKTTAIRDLAETKMKVSCKNIKIGYDKSKLIGSLSRIPHTAKTRQILGWHATSSLKIGICKTFNWME